MTSILCKLIYLLILFCSYYYYEQKEGYHLMHHPCMKSIICTTNQTILFCTSHCLKFSSYGEIEVQMSDIVQVFLVLNGTFFIYRNLTTGLAFFAFS
jgi:hypothetical protein